LEAKIKKNGYFSIAVFSIHVYEIRILQLIRPTQFNFIFLVPWTWNHNNEIQAMCSFLYSEFISKK